MAAAAQIRQSTKIPYAAMSIPTCLCEKHILQDKDDYKNHQDVGKKRAVCVNKAPSAGSFFGG
jgi:hypothetical protein